MRKKPCFLIRFFIPCPYEPTEEVVLNAKMGEKHPTAVITQNGFYLKEETLDYSDLIELAKREQAASKKFK